MSKIFNKATLLLLLILFGSQLNSQNSTILKEFNNFFEEQREIDATEDYKERQKQQKKEEQDSILRAQQLLIDTLKSELLEGTEELVFNDEAEAVDSQLFIQKGQFPEVQMPNKVLKNEIDWQKEYLLSNRVAYKDVHVIDSSYDVFGWHPYWMGTAYESYNFSLLSMIAYFSYELDPNSGDYKTIHNWRTTALVDSAQAYGCKVLLTVTNFGSTNNHLFLSNLQAQKKLIRNLITLLKERGASGVNIDFEVIRKEDKMLLNNFLIDLSSSLKSENEDYLVTVAIPPIDFTGIYDIPNIESHIDKFIIMGYEFHGSHSKTAGPIAPLSSGNKWMDLNLERSVNEYMVTGIPPKKLIMALPYYGVEWQTYDLRFPSKVKSFQKFHTYRYIKNMVGNYSCVLDLPSSSKYYAYRDGGNNYRQIWFEDSTTLGIKYDWIKENGLGGVGIWALGYDNGHTELWELLASKFAYSPEQMAVISKNQRKVSIRRTMNLLLRLAKNPRSVLQRPRPILMLFGGFFSISMIGILMIIRYGHRFGRVFNITMKGSLSLIIILGLALGFLLLRYIDVKEIYILIGGIVLGLVLFYLFSRRFLSEKELP